MTQERIVIVTGGGSGIGKAIASQFANQNDQVIIIGRTESKLKMACEAIGKNADYIVADISQRIQVEQAIQTIVETYNTVDVLVNNAGFVERLDATMPLEDAEAIWDSQLGTNLKGAMLLSVGLAPFLRRDGGRIINISSIAAYTGGSRGGVIGYAAAKAGLHGLSCALARELSPQGITVNTISPGLIGETDFFGGGLTAERIRSVSEQIPVGRPGKPSEIASLVCFLASPQAAYITGEIIHANGGWLFGH